MRNLMERLRQLKPEDQFTVVLVAAPVVVMIYAMFLIALSQL